MPVASWRCERCGAGHPVDAPRYVCGCGGRLDLDLGDELRHRPPEDVVDATARGPWRYAALLPPAGAAARTVAAAFPSGGTPLLRADRLAGDLGVGTLWIKNEAMNPTGSLKDRASAVVVAAALSLGAPVVAAASSGNAAAAMAGACAAVGMPCVAFVPRRASSGRCGQLARFGARVLVVDGDYDDAVALSLAACAEWGWLCRTTAVNPFTTQGKKTVALEIVEQLGWSAPDAVVVPAGDGNILVGLHRGFRDAHALGWIDHVPRLVAVQAVGAAALHRAWTAGATDVAPAPADTVADGICVGRPLDGARALAALRDTGGTVVTVTDEAILAARRRLAGRAGVAAEPSSAAAAAALPDLVAAGTLGATDRVVLVNTGGVALPPEPVPDTVTTVSTDLAAVRDAVADLAGLPVATAHRRAGATLSGVSGT